MTRLLPARRGVTLIELLVVMAILTALAGLALMIAPNVAQKDNTLKGTSDVQTAFKVAQGMAAAAKLPRGVRLIAPPLGSATPNIVTEMQYLEVPPLLVPDPQVLVGTAVLDKQRPQVVFQYTLDATGAVTKRQCFIFLAPGAAADQAPQVVVGTTLTLPTLNFFSVIKTPLTGIDPQTNIASLGGNEVLLDVYPDAYLGGATAYATFHFGIYGAPRPLLGEPTIELPKNVCVDLSLCSPSWLGAGQNYDIIFAPSGQLLPSLTRPSGGQVFLWVRAYNKVPTMQILSTSPAWTMNPQQFQLGGEQQIVGIRGAAIGTAPVMWPDNMATGVYTAPNNPYTFARQKLTGP
jgi:prepilin-type N-terminal cleavage/methylation domain-containing protein